MMKLEISGLSFSYGERQVLEDISFGVAEGEFVSLLGPSGCGKSTVLKLLTGILSPDRGRILVDGEEIRGLSSHFAYMPQNDLLFPWKTILDNVCLYGRIHGSLEEMRERMGVPIIFKIGVETFDYDFRQRVLNKHADFREPGEVAEYFDSPCLMVGIQGQTKDMIRYDIDCLKRDFKRGTVNVYNNNTTPIRRDQALVDWFMDEYQWLMEDPAVEVLYEITDFGVG